jgi:hypothetical protein
MPADRRLAGAIERGEPPSVGGPLNAFCTRFLDGLAQARFSARGA